MRSWLRFGRSFVLIAIMLTGCDQSAFQSGTPQDNEQWAIGALQSLNAGLQAYHRDKGIYPRSWRELYPTGGGDYAPPQFRTHHDVLTGHPFNGYRFTYASGGGHRFTFIALPSRLGRTGTRAFSLDHPGAIRHCLPHRPDQQAGPLDRLIDVPAVGCLGI